METLKLNLNQKAYYRGEGGLEQSNEKALYWITKAAENGNTKAQFGLGLAYENGEGGLEQSKEKALYWVTKAAEHGNADAQYSLGLSYEYGSEMRGLEKNDEKAEYWLRKACENSHYEACSYLDKLKQSFGLLLGKFNK